MLEIKFYLHVKTFSFFKAFDISHHSPDMNQIKLTSFDSYHSFVSYLASNSVNYIQIIQHCKERQCLLLFVGLLVCCIIGCEQL